MRAIGWFNTMTTGKRQQAAKCVESVELGPLISPLVLKKTTRAPHAKSMRSVNGSMQCERDISGDYMTAEDRLIRWILEHSTIGTCAVFQYPYYPYLLYC